MTLLLRRQRPSLREPRVPRSVTLREPCIPRSVALRLARGIPQDSSTSHGVHQNVAEGTAQILSKHAQPLDEHATFAEDDGYYGEEVLRNLQNGDAENRFVMQSIEGDPPEDSTAEISIDEDARLV